jgi:hypothetical protein
MKPNWVCSTCGMWSNRKSSVKRHIMNLHGGNTSLVAFIDYVVGRQSGIYQPSFPGSSPNLPDSDYQNKGKKTPTEIFEEEFMKEKARLAARKDMGWNF